MRYLILFLLVSFGLTSCDSEQRSSGQHSQGRIVYDVSFPSMTDDLLANIFPDKMTMSFKNDRMHGRICSFADIYVLEVITDNIKEEQFQLLKKNRERLVTPMSKSEARDWLGPMPKITYTQTGETDTIAGFLCEKTIAIFENSERAPITLYHTNEIDIKNPNWFNPYPEISGVLMAYEMEQFGMRMSLRASEVNFVAIEESEFIPSEEYEKITFDDLRTEFNELLAFFD